MKCAYCKEAMGIKDPNEYVVEINGVECRICLHDDCLKKVIGEYFTKPNGPSSNHYVTVTPLKEPEMWGPKWTVGSTTDCPPPDTTRVWCKAEYDGTSAKTVQDLKNSTWSAPKGLPTKDNDDPHTPWKDRVD